MFGIGMGNLLFIILLMGVMVIEQEILGGERLKPVIWNGRLVVELAVDCVLIAECLKVKNRYSY